MFCDKLRIFDDPVEMLVDVMAKIEYQIIFLSEARGYLFMKYQGKGGNRPKGVPETDIGRYETRII
jgi:hypothetical protein